MPKKETDAWMDKYKKELNSFTPRNDQAIRDGRDKFLAQARMIQRSPVTLTPSARRNKWKPFNLLEVKMGTLATILVVTGLIFGGLTGTVAAAQDDLPGQALYQIKLMSESTKLGLTQDPLKRMDLDLQFAMRRLNEIKVLHESGIEAPYASYARFENHLQHAIAQTEVIDPLELPGALLRIREMLRTCLEIVDTTTDEPLQTRLRTMLQDRINWLDGCLENTDCVQNQMHKGWEATPSFGNEKMDRELIREQDRIREQLRDNLTVTPGNGPAYQTQKPDQPNDEPGNQNPGAGYQTPGPGYQTPGPGYQNPGPGNATPEPGYQTPGPGYQTPGPGYQTPGPGNTSPEPRSQTPGSGNQTPEPGGGGGNDKKP